MTSELKHAVWRSKIQRRDDGDGRTIDGIAVPFGDVIDTFDGLECFDQDTRFDGLENAKLCYQHGELVGKITGAQSRDDGLHITARVADTQTGNEMLNLIDCGALDSMSVGFIPVKDSVDDDGVTHRREVRLLETSVVSWPAYENAKITDHRDKRSAQRDQEKGNTMAEENNTMIDDLNGRLDSIEETQRSMQATIAKNQAPKDNPVIGSQYRSAADYLKALEHGEDGAATLLRRTRDLISTGDTGNTAQWITDQIRLITQRRKVTDLLTHAALPATGMSMEYNLVASDSTTAGEQEKEADPLAFGKITFATASVPVKTYGGYTTLSRQVIDRSTTPMLNTALTALTNAYAKATENAVRKYVYDLIASMRDGASANPLPASKTLTNLNIDDWTGIIIDASEEMDDRNATLGSLVVSSDVLKSLVALKDNNSRALDLSGSGADQIGSFDVTGIAGTLMRVPVRLLPKAPAGTAAFLDPSAITVWESGGPTQLTDGDPTKLTNDYSVYGYMAIGATFSDGILPIKFGSAN